MSPVGQLLRIMLIMCLSYLSKELVLSTPCHAQSHNLPITSSGLNTQVSTSIDLPGGKVQYDITGGTRAGANLFHSFDQFNVPINNIANFRNGVSFDLNGAALPAGLQTTNILARVTGPNPSAIFGTIQTTGFNDANLFLMNPLGIVFGPNASLDVGGSVTFTTTNYLRLAEMNGTAGIFHADSASSSILTSAPVAAFGFLTSNTAAIAVQGSRLSVSNGKAISLIGGNDGFDYANPDTGMAGTVLGGIMITNGQLSAPNGQINVTSVAARGETSASDFMPSSGMARGEIRLSHETRLDVSSDSGGTIRIRGGRLLITDATLSANTGNRDGAALAIDINATGNLDMTDTRGVLLITAQSTGTGDAGEVKIVSGNLDVSTTKVLQSPEETFALIDTRALSGGKGGNITIETGNLHVTGPSGLFYFLDSGVQADGQGGNVIINADTINLSSTTISTGSEQAAGRLVEAGGPSGNLTIEADSLRTIDAHLNTTATASLSKTQRGGDILLRVRDINLGPNTSVNATGYVGGEIAIIADRLFTEATGIGNFTLDAGKGITFTGRILELTDGSTMSTSTFGNGKAGDISITATDHIRLIGSPGDNPLGEFNPSGIFSNSLGYFGQGGAGNIAVTTPRLTLDAGRINTSTASSGRGGNVTIDAGIIEMSGEFPNTFGSDFFFAIGDIHPSGIFTQTVGSEFCTGPCGNAGNILITTDSIRMAAGSQINSGTTNNGSGGNISIRSTNTIAISGTLTDGSPVGIFSRTIGQSSDAGWGGNISLIAGQSVTIKDGATVSASSTGPGDAGSISIHAGQQFNAENGTVTTSAKQANGGNIDITATDLVRVVNGHISTSVLGGSGNGGNISIDPNTVILQNSQIVAKAVSGAGGNISITTPLFLADQASLVDASSQFGLNGTVTIQSPTSNLSGTIGQLSSKPAPIHLLAQNRCAALADGQQSTFILSGRQTFPTIPGGWTPSPFTSLTMDILEPNEARVPPVNFWNTGLLTLRSLTSPGFFVRSFPTTEQAGCRL